MLPHVSPSQHARGMATLASGALPFEQDGSSCSQLAHLEILKLLTRPACPSPSQIRRNWGHWHWGHRIRGRRLRGHRRHAGVWHGRHRHRCGLCPTGLRSFCCHGPAWSPERCRPNGVFQLENRAAHYANAALTAGPALPPPAAALQPKPQRFNPPFSSPPRWHPPCQLRASHTLWSLLPATSAPPPPPPRWAPPQAAWKWVAGCFEQCTHMKGTCSEGVLRHGQACRGHACMWPGQALLQAGAAS